MVVGEIPKYVIPDPLTPFRYCGNSTYTETKNKIRRLNLGQHPRLKKFEAYFNHHFLPRCMQIEKHNHFGVGRLNVIRKRMETIM